MRRKSIKVGMQGGGIIVQKLFVLSGLEHILIIQVGCFWFYESTSQPVSLLLRCLDLQKRLSNNIPSFQPATVILRLVLLFANPLLIVGYYAEISFCSYVYNCFLSHPTSLPTVLMSLPWACSEHPAKLDRQSPDLLNSSCV